MASSFSDSLLALSALVAERESSGLLYLLLLADAAFFAATDNLQCDEGEEGVNADAAAIEAAARMIRGIFDRRGIVNCVVLVSVY